MKLTEKEFIEYANCMNCKYANLKEKFVQFIKNLILKKQFKVMNQEK